MQSILKGTTGRSKVTRQKFPSLFLGMQIAVLILLLLTSITVEPEEPEEQPKLPLPLSEK
jgi:hypothetical protein